MSSAEFERDSYAGVCRICGTAQEFTRELLAIRETYRCRACKALLREREQAEAILSCYPQFGAATLSELVKTEEFRSLRIYEPGTTGPFRAFLRDFTFYYQSDYYGEAERDAAPANIPHQDLEALRYPDEFFDLVISSDILEHVRKPERAFAEIARVLRRGGRHVFTVPLQLPMRPRSIARVDTSGDTDVPLLPAHYHGNGKGGKSLVYTDFGADIADMLAAAGCHAAMRQPAAASEIAGRAVTIIATKA